MARAEASDVRDRVVERIDHPDAQLQIEELGGVVVVGRDAHRRHERPRSIAADELDTGRAPRATVGKNSAATDVVHEQALGRVAHRRPLHLGVDGDALGHGQIGGGIDVDMAVAVTVDDVGHGGVLEYRPDQRRPTARDQHIDHLASLHELDGGLVAGVFDEHDRVSGQPDFGQRVAEHGHDRPVGIDGARAAPEERRVAGFDAQDRPHRS